MKSEKDMRLPTTLLALALADEVGDQDKELENLAAVL